MMHMKNHLEIIAELTSHTGREEEPVNDQYKKYCRQNIRHAQEYRRGLSHRHGRHRQSKTGDKDRVNRCSRSSRIHTGYHDSRDNKMGGKSCTEGQNQDYKDTTRRGAYESGTHPVIAVFVHRPKKEKSIHDKPVGMSFVKKHIHRHSYHQNNAHPQSKPHLKRIRAKMGKDTFL